MKKHNPEEWKNIRGGWTDLPTLRERVESAEMYITSLEADIDLYFEGLKMQVEKLDRLMVWINTRCTPEQIAEAKSVLEMALTKETV